MDILFNLISVATNLSSTDRQYKNLNFQIKYALRKAHHLLEKIEQRKIKQEDKFFITNLHYRIKQAESISRQFDNLLNTDNIAIRDKIRLNLPFNQTKKSATDTLEALQKAVLDIKEQIDCEQIEEIPGSSLIASRMNNSQPRKKIRQCKSIQLEQSNYRVSNLTKSDIFLAIPKHNHNHHSSNQEQNQMGPTIRSEDFYTSEKKSMLNLKVETISTNKDLTQIFEANKKMFIIEQSLNLAKVYASGEQNKKEDKQKNVCKIARINYKSVYSSMRKITKDIDGISTNDHFSFIVITKHRAYKPSNNSQFSKDKNTQSTNQSLKRLKTRDCTAKKKALNESQCEKVQQEEILYAVNAPQNSKTEKIQNLQHPGEQVFYSFSCAKNNERHENEYNFKIIMRKSDPKKKVYQKKGTQWVLVEENQLQVINGDCFAAYLDPKKQVPQIVYRISYTQENI